MTTVDYIDRNPVPVYGRTWWVVPPGARTDTWVSFQGVDKASLVEVSQVVPPGTPMVIPVAVTARVKGPGIDTFSVPAAPGDPDPVTSGVGGMLFGLVACFLGVVAGDGTETSVVEWRTYSVRGKITLDEVSQVMPPPATMAAPAA